MALSSALSSSPLWSTSCRLIVIVSLLLLSLASPIAGIHTPTTSSATSPSTPTTTTTTATTTTTTTTTITASTSHIFERLHAVGVDPDATRNISEIVLTKGYPFETHLVPTDDDWMLTMFRIPYGRAGPTAAAAAGGGGGGGAGGGGRGVRPAVLLQHGLLDSAFTWVLNEPSQSLPYILADQGYDVWMGNSRGNIYSMINLNYTKSEEAFWAFSWDEMARYDFPGNIAYITNLTGQSKINYVGHSQGTIQAFAGLIIDPSLANKLNLAVMLGPVVSAGHCTNVAIDFLAKFDLDKVFLFFGLKDFFPSPVVLRGVFEEACDECSECCADVIELICGPHRGAFNNSRMQVMAGHEPGGTSVTNMAHWAQSVRNGTFAMYDFETSKENEQHYGQPYPPVYDFSKFPKNLPVALISGGQDELADPIDVTALNGTLHSNGCNVVLTNEIPSYAHLDFCWALDANVLVYQNITNLLSKYN